MKNKHLKAVVVMGKTCLRGKRKVIDGGSLISMAKLTEIQQAEKVIRERSIKRETIKKQRLQC